jgi:hypothetical protein
MNPNIQNAMAKFLVALDLIMFNTNVNLLNFIYNTGFEIKPARQTVGD